MGRQVRLWKVRFAAILPLAVLLIAIQAVSQVTPAPDAAPDAARGAAPGAIQGASPSTRPRRGFGPAIGVPTVGMPFVHDPSTVVRFHGKYYVYSTGRGAPFYSSPDGVTWTREGSVFPAIPDDVHAAVPKNNGSDVWAPDIIRVGNQFYLYYAVSSWGSFQSAIGLATNPVLDPKDPAYKWTDRGVVVSSNGNEDLNAIDPGAIRAPDGTLWLSYGSYHGTIDLVQLDPRTGLRIAPNSPVTIVANASEASDIIFNDGYYYLFVNHGSCCKGKDSTYNIRVGRARSITGPYIDRDGAPLATGGGTLFLASDAQRIGPGHFGLLRDYDTEPREAGLNDVYTGHVAEVVKAEAGSDTQGAERFSIHYEADMTRDGRSALDIRPLLWSPDGWPIAGDNLVEGTYRIVSRRSENTPQSNNQPLAGVDINHLVSGQNENTLESYKQPTGGTVPALAPYISLDNQKWTITPVGGGFYKIVNVATGNALETNGIVLAFGTLVDMAPYTGADIQMWHLDQFPDSRYRIRNKTGLSLGAGTGDAVALNPFVQNDWFLWTVATP